MKAIIGLGNPDTKYLNTRHNVGFMVIDKILAKRKLNLAEKFNSFFVKDEDTIFLMPKTYMNLSGRAVIDLMRFYKLRAKDILVIFDDASLNLGKLRFRNMGSDGGHNGIKSIIENLNTNKFDRLKIGTGPIPENMPLEHFVLGNFKTSEKPQLEEALNKSLEAVEDYLTMDFVKLQNKYN